MSLFRRRPPVLVSRCPAPGGRRGSWRAPHADRDASDARCGIDRSKFDGTKLDGARPTASALGCLKASLRAEKDATAALATARAEVIRCLHEARAGGSVTLTAIATALVPAQSNPFASMKARKRAAQALACRLYESRRRTRQG
jgi:hypothetical protein